MKSGNVLSMNHYNLHRHSGTLNHSRLGNKSELAPSPSDHQNSNLSLPHSQRNLRRNENNINSHAALDIDTMANTCVVLPIT